ncbi:MAG: nicotinamide riboside transporter PnuC [Bacteroidales bacterium]|nr:nicotinamide riboside transporter PnuC [Bacteroidales bacterium]
MEWIDYTLFHIGQAPVLLIDIITSVFGLTCVFLAGRNSKYNFWVGYLYTAALFLMFWNKGLVASLILQPISLAINIMGHWRWTHPREGEQSSEDKSALKVTKLSWAGRVFCIAAVLIIAGAWGWILEKFVHVDPLPYLDSCVTILILMAQLLSALKKWDCWIAWMIVNITQIILHISVGHVFMPIVCGLYLVNGIWSLITWTKLYSKKA